MMLASVVALLLPATAHGQEVPAAPAGETVTTPDESVAGEPPPDEVAVPPDEVAVAPEEVTPPESDPTPPEVAAVGQADPQVAAAELTETAFEPEMETPQPAGERAAAGAPQRRRAAPPGYCNRRPDPRGCHQDATDRARDSLCGGDTACEAAFDSSPCVAQRESAACLAFIASRPCIADASSFECTLWQAAQRSYCAIEYTQLYCGGSGSPGPEPFGRPGAQPRTELIGLVDTGVSGRLRLVEDGGRRDRSPRPLAMTGHQPGASLLLALALLMAGAALRRAARG
jgi:hypothetical protein